MTFKKAVNILLIEDNPDHIELIKKELKNNGVINNIYVAEDGKKALDFLFHRGEYKDPNKAPKPGLILLDLKLPKIDGLEVLKQIKANGNLKKIPVVVLTTSDQKNDIEKCYEYGVNSYLCKPVKFIDFQRVVKEIKLYWVLTNCSVE